MADLDRFSLFTEARERLGRALVAAVSATLPEAADALERAAEGEPSIAGRRALFATSAEMRIEAGARAQRALSRLYDLTFRLLELNQSGASAEGGPPLLALLGDEAPDQQSLVDELARAVRESLGEAHVPALRRVESLTRTPTDDARAPLGAAVLAAAALEAWRPHATAAASRGALRDAAIGRLAPRLAASIAEVDAWLAARGVEPRRRPDELAREASSAVEDVPQAVEDTSQGVEDASEADGHVPPARDAGDAAHEGDAAPGHGAAPASGPPPSGAGTGQASGTSEDRSPSEPAATVPERAAAALARSETTPPAFDAGRFAQPVAEPPRPGSASVPGPRPAAEPTPADAPIEAPGGASIAPAAAPEGMPIEPAAAPGGMPIEPAVPVPIEAPAEAAIDVPAAGAATPESAVATADAPMERAAEALVHATQVADVLGRQPFAVGRAESGYRHAGVLPRPEALERDGVAFAHHVGVAPYTRPARQRFFDGLRERMLASQAPPAQLAALDLVAALFDYVVDDTRMPAAAQPLLWRLQHPAVTLAALDAGFLGDDRRSMRRLVENLSAISVAYADDVTKGSELYRRLETVVRAVEVVAHAFQTRSSVLGEQVRREYERAAQGVAQLVSRVAKERTALESTPGRRNRRDYSRRPSREREQEVTRRLESELRDRLARCEVPESVRDFLLGVWLRHLRTALLRDGEESAQFRLAIQVVDDLLWSLDTSGPRQSRRELAGRIPPLIRLLTQGVVDIGARPEEFRPFLDELFLIHLRKMQKVPHGDTEARPTTRSGDGPPSLAAPAMPETPRADPTFPAPPAPPAPDAPDAPPVPDAPPTPGASPSADASTKAPTAPDAPVASVAPAPSPVGPAEPALDASVPSPDTAADTPTLDECLADPAPDAPAAADAASVPPAPPTHPLPLRPEAGTVPPQAQGPGAAPSASTPTSGNGTATPGASSTPPHPGLPRRPILPPGPPDEGRSGDQRLLSVLSTLDLGDFPETPQRLRLDADEALARLRRGDWLELIGRDGLPQEVKVAWINSRRTVVLLVRRPDRRALSLRAAELHQRFAQHKAALIV